MYICISSLLTFTCISIFCFCHALVNKVVCENAFYRQIYEWRSTYKQNRLTKFVYISTRATSTVRVRVQVRIPEICTRRLPSFTYQKSYIIVMGFVRSCLRLNKLVDWLIYFPLRDIRLIEGCILLEDEDWYLHLPIKYIPRWVEYHAVGNKSTNQSIYSIVGTNAQSPWQ